MGLLMAIPFLIFSQNPPDSSFLPRKDTAPLIIDTSPVLSPESTTKKEQRPNTLSNDKRDKVGCQFTKEIIELDKGDIISNVLKLYNNTSQTLNVSLNLLYPAEWRKIGANRDYQLNPNDTIFVPITLVPRQLTNENTEILINVFVLDENSLQIGNNYFTIKTRKKVSWSVSTAPSDRFYFKNGETEKEFDLNIINTGNGNQDIFVSQSVLKENLILYDTNGRIIKNPNYTINLDPKEDTTISYVASAKNDDRRNKKRISTNGYTPSFDQTYEKYDLFVATSEPNSFGESAFKKSNKVSFIKLPNQDRMEEFGKATVPLIVEANVQNILDDATFMSLNLRGFKQLNEEASIVYFSQLNYSNSFFTNTVFQNSPWFVGYYDNDKTVEVGQISSNMIGINAVGKGVRATYRFNQQHKTQAFWVRSAGFFGARRSESVGLSHTFKYNNNFRVVGNYGRQVNPARNVDIDAISLQPNFNINKRHYFNLLAATTIRNDRRVVGSNSTVQGYLFGGSYSTRFLDNSLRTNLSGRFNERAFAFGTVQRSSYNHRSIFDINEDWNVFVANRYQKTDNYSPITNGLLFEQEILTNSLVFSTNTREGTIQPGIYYDYRNIRPTEIFLRGLSLRYSSFNFEQNYLGSFAVRAGYSLPLGLANETARRDYFTFQFNTFIRLNVWNFSARYNYGVFSFSTAQNFESTGTTPQDLRLSFQNQYQFKNKHFILESNFIYNYNNSFNGHNLGVFPEIFYFTNSGWRFSFRANYNFSTRKFRPVAVGDSLPVGVFEDPERTFNNDVVLGATVRKEFGIPIPFVKKTTASIDFVCFFDIDGDGEKDRDEPAIENVVIQMGKKEVITNEDGVAALENVPKGFQPIYVLALEDLQGWFPNIDDSLFIVEKGTQYVPFARGVKVYGDVILDRQQIGVADTSKAFDLSRIKISALNGKVYNTLTDVNGRFEFYLPNGKYQITMDENVLGTRYSLSRNNLEIELKDKQGGSYVSFFIIEKRKKVIRKKFGQ